MSAIKNGNGVPDWMAKLGVQKGEWLYLTKAHLRSQMRPDRPLKVQVWACGMLHTTGYRGELATTKRDDQIVPLTAADIAAELHRAAKDYYKSAGIEDKEGAFASLKEDRAEIRATLAALEEDGVAERQTIKGTPLRDLTGDQLRRLPSGQTRILFWLKPKAADPERVRAQWEERQAEIELSSDDDDFATDGDAQLADEEESVSRWDVSKVEVGKYPLRPVAIQQILFNFGIESPEKTKMEDPAYQAIITRAWAAARETFLHVVNSSLPEVGAASPPEVGAGAPPLIRKESVGEIDAESSTSSSSVAQPQSDDDARAFLETTIGIDRRAARKLFRECRHQDASITAPVIVELWRAKAAQIGKARNVDNWIGLMLIAVPESATGAPLAAARKAVAHEAGREAREAERLELYRLNAERDDEERRHRQELLDRANEELKAINTSDPARYAELVQRTRKRLQEKLRQDYVPEVRIIDEIVREMYDELRKNEKSKTAGGGDA